MRHFHHLASSARIHIAAWSLAFAAAAPIAAQPKTCPDVTAPRLIVLGIAQDAGDPQAGTKSSPGFEDQALRHFATSLGLLVPSDSSRWLFEATPDFKDQLHLLDVLFPVTGTPGLAGIFLTHAHIGHYLGLAQLGHEVMGASGVPVYAMPRMRRFLSENGPWDQLVRFENIELRSLEKEVAIQISDGIRVVPLVVPHRDEYSETVGFEIAGPERTVLFIPDINKWEMWDRMGTRVEDVLSGVDLAFLDGSFFADGEIPGRDMSGFPHPFITESMTRLERLAPEIRSRVYFIHLNHTNPALRAESAASQAVLERGFNVAREGDCYSL